MFRVIFFFIGFIICAYPCMSNMIERQHQKDAVATYKDTVAQSEEKNMDDFKRDAILYNDALFDKLQGITAYNDFNKYEDLLNISNGIMGSISIPSINVDLPIYHGTGEDVLSVGIGHLEGTSLPIGGINTRSVLTGHRGLANSKLFTRLDELVKGDLFFINTLNDTIAYKVVEIKVIDPEDMDQLAIIPEKDLISLVTCTPYGINSHRLVVTGERTNYTQDNEQQVKPNIPSLRELFFTIIPFVFLGITLLSLIIKMKRRG